MAEVQAQVKDLLTFLTRDAKVPLAIAIAKYSALRDNGLTTPEAISKTNAAALGPIFSDEKIVKQVISAAKRVSNPKKRSLSDASHSLSKQPRLATTDREALLGLPVTDIPLESIPSFTIETNRAPLFLAFAFVVAGHVLRDQPLSSRLSLAQAVTSAGAQSKAKFIGLTNSTAEDEGWAEGQPKVRLMGREIAVMRRHVAADIKSEPGDSNEYIPTQEAFWGIDLDAMKKSNASIAASKSNAGSGLPVHRPEAARAYLLKSIDLHDEPLVEESETSIKTEGSVTPIKTEKALNPIKTEESVTPTKTEKALNPIKTEESVTPTKTKKLSPAERAARREQAVALLLKALDHVCASWAQVLSNDDLDRRANSWYSKVRPSVEGGQAGWGQRGLVPLRIIMDLARSE